MRSFAARSTGTSFEMSALLSKRFYAGWILLVATASALTREVDTGPGRTRMPDTLKVDMLPAEQGDALWIEYGEAARPHRVLFDAGTEPTWRRLRPRIAALPPSERHFDLLVVSHIDKDHIGGTLPLLADTELGARFDDVWFNGWRHLPGTAPGSRGPIEGERLTTLLSAHPWNAAFDGRAVVVPSAGSLPVRELPGGLRLTLLSPTPEQLARLRPVWREVVEEHGLDPATPAARDAELPPGLERSTAERVPDVQALSARRFRPDMAEANGTSIVVLAEFEGRSVILSADAYPAVILQAVDRLLSGREGERLALSAFKLPHHGSRANVHLPLLERLDCRDYLFSTDGSRTGHPNPESVARVLSTTERPRLWFNYRTEHNAVWGRPKVIERFGHEAVYPREGEEGLAYECP